MDNEETQTKGETAEISAVDTGDGDKPEAASIVDRAHAENERMEANLKKREELIAREEKMRAIDMLGGKTNAIPQRQKKEEQSNLDYAKEALSGKFDSSNG